MDVRIVTEFDDRIAADDKRLYPDRDLVCAHMLERLGQRQRKSGAVAQ